MDSGFWRRGGTPQQTFTEADIAAADDRAGSEYREIPEIVEQFVRYMYKCFLDRNTSELHTLYETVFARLTEHYYKASTWPSSEMISRLVDNDANFLMFYNELYYRHLFSKMQPSLAQRYEGWMNYRALFNHFMQDGMVDYDLPVSWIWDIIDEFIYQFESWCQYRAKLMNKSSEEIQYLRQNDSIWSVQTVLSLLHYLVNKSNIISWLLNNGDPTGSDDPDSETFDISTLAVYRYIGYFAIIGLLRVNTLLGDYRLALMVLQPLDFDVSSALFTHVTACHVSIYYYMGFCYIMLRRYEDAARIFSSTVLHIGRIKHNHTRSYQYEQINKRNDQMMALLALCLTLQPLQVDESMMSMVREKAGDRLARLRQGEPHAFEDLFIYASPKFICPAAPDYDVIDDTNMEAPRLQTKLFMEEVKSQLLLPEIRSYLKLYTKIEIEKLAALMDVDESTLRSHLHALKHKSWTMTGSFHGPPLQGEWKTSSDVGFHVERNVVHISDTKTSSRYGEYFIQNIGKLDDLYSQLKRRMPGATTSASKARSARVA
ncbi:Translation initiation factor eIF3, subunit L [Chondrus crispus]|uniref:Eukaryotic translation initiation factor 3 subunit L n=1 Tax=Chondrus crispus TaxID=2769 RepID=R7QLU4_CHOCR|nr:Translation initiation factor eIF3, subunit L [Chondrus crispus]CDF39054.1 Translation initiation factor eIF3, subunit L [Chondrus crispus]|eukprot:XP_005718965.1 Translation initiation factor eIF3, subunit L [Chondrus crispus]